MMYVGWQVELLLVLYSLVRIAVTWKIKWAGFIYGRRWGRVISVKEVERAEVEMKLLLPERDLQ